MLPAPWIAIEERNKQKSYAGMIFTKPNVGTHEDKFDEDLRLDKMNYYIIDIGVSPQI